MNLNGAEILGAEFGGRDSEGEGGDLKVKAEILEGRETGRR
jgi:hypothetical protein